jgi:hypothetical protein
MKSEDYRLCVEELRINALKLVGLLSLELPDRTTPESAFARRGGSSQDNETLRAIAGQVDQVLYSFCELQETLGLPNRAEGRYRRFLSPATESTAMAATATEPKPTKKPGGK